jgi:hypothetical protein
MSISRRSGSSRAVTLLLVLALLVSAASLVACGGTKESPGGPSGTGASPEAEALVAPQDVRDAVLAVLNAAGITADPMYVYVNFRSAAKDSVLVQGTLKNKDGAAVSTVALKSVNGAWTIDSAK